MCHMPWAGIRFCFCSVRTLDLSLKKNLWYSFSYDLKFLQIGYYFPLLLKFNNLPGCNVFQVWSHVLLCNLLLTLDQLSSLPAANRAGGENLPALRSHRSWWRHLDDWSSYLCKSEGLKFSPELFNWLTESCSMHQQLMPAAFWK